MIAHDPYSGALAAAEASPARPKDHHGLAFPPLDILVVDDDENVRKLVASILRHAGHRVKCANDGQDGWEALCAGRYDGMITDNDMPRLSGLDLVSKLRALPSSLPVIMISGRISWDETELAVFLEPGLVREKPFSCSELLSDVRQLFIKTESAAFARGVHESTCCPTSGAAGTRHNDPF